MLVLLFSSLFASCLYCTHASLHSTIPEDLYAFPKYRISFLNGLPVSNDTAEKWLRHGLQGGEAEFLGRWHPDTVKEIGSGDSPPAVEQPPPRADLAPSSPALEHMRLGSTKSYLCLIPTAPTPPPPAPDDAAVPLTPSHSWSLLQPLSGTCIYHRQGWFTYSYCHNVHVRQFRELPATYPHPPGARVVEEDPEWESYTLGRAAPSVAGEAHDAAVLAANNLELARQTAGQRYLVQRWSDGTICDKNGRPREVEVQFHCSMTMMDTIMFVKETRTCEYVLVVHTPRLCGEPGFKSRLEQTPEAMLRCREVIAEGAAHDEGEAKGEVEESAHPFRRAPRQDIPAPQTAEDKDTGTDKDGESGDGEDAEESPTHKLLRRALEALIARRAAGAGAPEGAQVFELEPGEVEGEFFLNVNLGADGDGADGAGLMMADVLRMAGEKNVEEGQERKKEKGRQQQENRDEL